MAKARILVVDDQLYFRAFAEELLVSEGYAVLTAEGPEDALRLLERERFDVILTDLVMPGMTGGEFVERVKESWPDQELVVVTGVGDVRTAVDAMRRGATDYVLKPVDRGDLLHALETILQHRRVSQERSRLLAENLEYLGALSVYERALSFLSTLALEPLADRVIEGLCLEARAQGGVLWLARPDEPERFALAAARGLVRPEHEPEELTRSELPAGLEPLAEPDVEPFFAPGPPGCDASSAARALLVPLRHAGLLLGFARLTDKLAGASFDARDRLVAARLAEPAAIAAANALRHRALEGRTFRDPVTHAYTWDYFQDVLRNEIEKASRFGRALSIVTVELDALDRVRASMADAAYARWLGTLVTRVAGLLRASDLLAERNPGRYALLLSETDALGAAVLKRRIRELLEQGGLLRPHAGAAPGEAPGAAAASPTVALRLATVSYPVDGTQIEALERVAAARAAEDGASLVGSLGLRRRSLGEALDSLAERGEPLSMDSLDQIFRFVLDELDRRAGERGVLCVAPGSARVGVVRDALARLDPGSTRTDVVFVSDVATETLAGTPVTCVAPQRVGRTDPFLIYYAEGPTYALVAESAGSGEVRVFHSAERTLVEELAFQLQRDLGIPIGRTP